MRLQLLVLAMLLAVAVPVVAEANPGIGYIPPSQPVNRERTATGGDTLSYGITMILSPADGETSIDLEIGYDATSEIAPATLITLTGPSGEEYSYPAFSGTGIHRTMRVTRAEWAFAGEQYHASVQVTLSIDQAPGDLTSQLRFIARDPFTQSSSPGFAYPFTFRIPNPPPVAAFGYSIDQRQVQFDASASNDPQGEPLTFAWNFGDGTTSSQAAPLKTFATGGAYLVRLTVTDPHGATDMAEQSITLALNQAPVASYTFTVDKLVAQFDASASEDPEGRALQYHWSFGDGTTATIKSPGHAFDEAGAYTVTLTVTDEEGATASQSKTVRVFGDVPPNAPPNAAFTFTREGLRVTFISQSNDPDGNVISHAWTFGDGETASSSNPIHTYPRPGSYAARLTVTDIHGESTALVREVFVVHQTAKDFDGDGFEDTFEEASGSDPKNPRSTPDDRDADGKLNEKDNCPGAPNVDQEDQDADGIGDACDLDNDDGPTGDPDADGVPSAQDNCPATPNTDQADQDKDGSGDACDSDRDGDGVLDGADAFPQAPAESNNTDGDSRGDNADLDDDGDGIPDSVEIQQGTDPLDRQDPPFRAQVAVSFRLENGTNRIDWSGDSNPRVKTFLVWREASPLVLIHSFPNDGEQDYTYYDEDAPSRARYHIQALLTGAVGLLYNDGDARVTNWVTSVGASLEECDGQPDGDGDGLCDALEQQMGLDPADRDGDGDGLDDGEELRTALTLPFEADTDGDGVKDGLEIERGTDPLDPASYKAAPLSWRLVALMAAAALVIAGAVFVVLRRRPA